MAESLPLPEQLPQPEDANGRAAVWVMIDGDGDLVLCRETDDGYDYVYVTPAQADALVDFWARHKAKRN